MTVPLENRFSVNDAVGEVTGILTRPVDAGVLLVFGHGAGAGARHPFMQGVADRLAERGVAVFRYQFPYMEAGRKAPNRAPVLTAVVRAATVEAARLAPDLPLFAGGKSMGGRMTSLAASQGALPAALGLAFFGFPLHASGKPGTERAGHLSQVGLPMLFLQGTRDRLADLDLLSPVLDVLQPAPTLHVVDGADHGFHVLKRSGRTDEEVLEELCDAFCSWARELM
jgi:predicted alpha/beta-hydrolase family hydrolase